MKSKKSINIWIFTQLAIFFIVAGFSGCSSEGDMQVRHNSEFRRIMVSGRVIDVEIADTKKKREKGLSGRKSLDDDSGMFFEFPGADRRVFWMKGCRIDLDIAYLDSKGIIREIRAMKKENENIPDNLLRSYESKSDDIMYALEMNAGWFKRNKISVGDKVTNITH